MIDSGVVSLFESSLGVVKAPVLSLDEYDSDNNDFFAHPEAESVAAPFPSGSPKRNWMAANHELEDKYMQQLDSDDNTDRRAKKVKQSGIVTEPAAKKDEQGICSISSDEDNNKNANAETNFLNEHESFISPKVAELDKSDRTIFLGNVPSNAIYSKHDCKTLKKFFSSTGKISHVRFRSVAFSDQIPRKVAFVNHKLHAKQQTVNAYVVYRDIDSVQQALKLNGSVVLGRHIRVDSVAHPGKQEPRQCVFVGNLDFEVQEENLWRHFGQCGKVQYVRVIRDPQTNIGKGFAYVQFQDVVSVEYALLLNGKKMDGDRNLRVTRAQLCSRNNTNRNLTPRPAPQTPRVRVSKVDLKQQAMTGDEQRLKKVSSAILETQIKLFEGRRATSSTNSGIKNAGTGKNKGVRITTRSSAWRKN
ncbi:hypothetical protein K440DRAFT_600071 [Wilcoxina mikolae CBS 423.85]|nr:hypothetical protein K440DRAFT_600071 [Wilcoxina mikolae CBS 423.85]